MKYATQFDEKTMARAQGVALPISLKQSAEVCRFIRNRKYSQAVRLLEYVSEMKIPVPYSRFNRGGTGHKPGMAAGRYPVKVCKYMLKLLKSVNANASQKGLDTNSLVIKAVVAKQGPKTFHYGRHRGRKAKRTHIEIIVMEIKQKKPEPKKTAKPTATPAAKPVVKPKTEKQVPDKK